MSHGVHANFEPFEGTVTTATTLTFNRKSRKIIITNDHPTEDLTYKFNDSETAGTLRGTETLSLFFVSDKLIIDGTNVPYRVWVFG